MLPIELTEAITGPFNHLVPDKAEEVPEKSPKIIFIFLHFLGWLTVEMLVPFFPFFSSFLFDFAVGAFWVGGPRGTEGWIAELRAQAAQAGRPAATRLPWTAAPPPSLSLSFSRPGRKPAERLFGGPRADSASARLH